MNFILSIPPLAWLALSAVFFAAGEFLSKKFALAPSWSYVLLVACAYLLGSLAWLPAILQKNQLSIVGAIWSVLSLLTTILIGVLIFGEHLNTTAIIGIILAFVAVFLLSIA
jgi:multidrug transporter EmrE-like cation transporter